MYSMTNIITHLQHLSKPLLIFITGASGAGKTTLLQAIEKKMHSPMVAIHYFDSIGIPTTDEMIRVHGSTQQWQKHTTHIWIDSLIKSPSKLIFLEGSFDPKFVKDYLQHLKYSNYLMFCLHTDRHAREERLLFKRNQPELVHQDMENFAEHLRKQTIQIGGHVIENHLPTMNQAIDSLLSIIAHTLTVGNK